MSIRFLPFQELHLPLLRQWLNQEHIKDHWQETEDDDKLKAKFLIELPKRGVSAFIIDYDDKKIGFIQYYEACKVGGGWWPKERAGVFGMDLMIGIEDLLGQGLGPKIVNHFFKFVREREPMLTSMIIDPDPGNQKAIRAFEKSGFVREENLTTPGGPALLMRKKPLPPPR